MADGNFTAESAAQHQAELNDYLQSKNINQLFIQIVESLLIEKPENPVGFIVEFLQKKYPEQADVSLTGGFAPGAAAAPGGGGAGGGQALEDEEEDSEIEDNDDDDAFEPKKYDRSTRRGMVCGEAEGDIAAEEIKEVAKSEAERARIEEILATTTIFKHLPQEQRELVGRAMTIVEKDQGAEIIKQGDDGDFFYAIDKGDVECFVTPKPSAEVEEPEPELVKTYGPGDTFGELAIMYNAPRAATCVAHTTCRLFALDRKAFKIILTKSSIEKRAKTKAFLAKVEILQQLKEYELFSMADAMTELTYDEHDVICRQGDQGNNFYIIAAGGVVCTQADAKGEPVEVAKLAAGDYFGEIALLTSKPRQATVTAAPNAGPLKLLSLDRGTFTRVLGPIDDILRRNMAAYNKFRAQNI